MRRAFLCILMIFTLILGGCSWFGPSQPVTPNPPDTSGPEETSWPLTLMDDYYRTVTLAEPAQRIVTLEPAGAEIVFALGAGDRIVGASEYCDYPEAAQNIPRVGGIDAPNLELIVSLEPDLVLASNMHKDTVEALEEMGITALALDPGDFEGIYANIELVAAAVGEEDAGRALIQDMENRLDAVASALEGLQEQDRPLVFYEVWYPGIYTAGEDTFIDEMISRAGGKNLAWGMSRWAEIQEEEVLERNPDIILHGHFSTDSSIFAQREGWDVITAVEEDAIYFINPDITSRTGPRVVDAVEEMAGIFHPDKFE